MAPRSLPTSVILTLASVTLLLGGCDLFSSGLQVSELERSTVGLLRQLPVEPLGGPDFDVTTTEVKLDAPYVSAHGVGRDSDVDQLVAALTAQLQADGFEVISSGPIDHIHGFEVLASDGVVVVRAQLGAGDAGSAIYPPLQDGAYLVVQMANTRSGPDWTDVNL